MMMIYLHSTSRWRAASEWGRLDGLGKKGRSEGSRSGYPEPSYLKTEEAKEAAKWSPGCLGSDGATGLIWTVMTTGTHRLSDKDELFGSA